MNTKETIEWIKERMDENLSEEYDNKKMNNIIELLQRGEKYEEMWNEARDYFQNDLDLDEYMEDIKQKYFPKGGSQ